MKRIQSPSSINTYKQCPRKYYYCYVKKLKTKPSIHLVRGKLVHSAMEDFFKVDISKISAGNYEVELKAILLDIVNKHWTASLNQINNLGLEKRQVDYYFDETKGMIDTWFSHFINKLNDKVQYKPLAASFKELTPKTEVRLLSEKFGVQGYIDAILVKDDKVYLIDYKTSNKKEIISAYKTQLAIYALLYRENFNKVPDVVGIDFLKFGEEFMPVDEDLLNLAELECEVIHLNTTSENEGDYPKRTGPLCKYSTGECDFYDACFENSENT